ncbi:hypothetical protein IFR04_011301 [Cadophora malorum]|uniref:Uncharacterized protein n=1 Tax=Cadophora malorum TaxID=108018 RepID=A0A8H7TB27_9HELO|nr:hypothetical protein IFR04_011301 [Cadophora malorum]
MEAEEVVRVVVTGGDVFKTFNFNSSLMVRGALPSRIDRAGKPPIVILKYPEGVLCSYDFVTNMMQKIWGGRAPEEISLALHMGMRDSHPEETTYCLEQLGHKTGYKQPGDDGRQFPEALIEEGGPWHELPDVLYSDFDLQATRSRIANALPALLLSVVLCGNLDLDPEAMTLDEEMLNLPSNSMESFSARWPDFTGSPNSETRNPSSPWTNVEHLVHELRNYRDAALQTQRQWPMHDATCPVPNCTEFKCIERPIARTQHIHEEIGRAKTMWLWFRGRIKRHWVERVWGTYELRHPVGPRGPMAPDEDMVALRRATTLTTQSWRVIIGMTLLLMVVPFILAILTAFYTPQLCRIILWLWAYAGAPEEGACPHILRKGGFLHRTGFYTPTDISSLRSRDTLFTLSSLWSFIWFSLAVIFGLGGVFTATGGTVMQLMGVYRSGFCDLDAEWWIRTHDEVPIVISTI